MKIFGCQVQRATYKAQSVNDYRLHSLPDETLELTIRVEQTDFVDGAAEERFIEWMPRLCRPAGGVAPHAGR
jgi:hypothetical protein